MPWPQTGVRHWKKQKQSWAGKHLNNPIKYFLAFSVILLLTACSPSSRIISLSNDQLQSLTDISYLSPQYRPLSLWPGINAQIYLDTPTFQLDSHHSHTLAFTFPGKINIELLGGELISDANITLSGWSDLRYSAPDRMFYLDNIQVDSAEVDMDTLSLQTLHMIDIRKPLEKAIAEIPVIVLTNHLQLSKQLANHAYTISRQDDHLLLTQMNDVQITENTAAP